MRLLWECETCGEPIEPGEGAVWCSDAAAYRCVRLSEEQQGLLDARTPPGQLAVQDGTEMIRHAKELRAAGYPVPWHVQHTGCDTITNRVCYWFDVERCDTLDDLLGWNEHLAHKRWLRFTNWSGFLRRAVRDCSRPDAA